MCHWRSCSVTRATLGSKEFKCHYDSPVPVTAQMRIHLVYMVTYCSAARRCRSYVLDAVYKAAREQSGPAVPLQCAFEPAVLPLPVNKHNVALLKFQLGLALGRI